MKIYQLHKYSGEWEDFCDRIIGSYLRKERAEEEKVKAEAREKALIEHGRKCSRCPFIEEPFDKLDILMSEYFDYCTKAKLKDSEYGMDCENYFSHWDDCTFDIKEVEVEE